MDESIQPVAESPVERVAKPDIQTVPELGLLTTTTTTTSTTSTTAMRAAVTPTVVPVEPMPSPIPGVPSPYHGVDFCIPVGPDFSLVTGLYCCHVALRYVRSRVRLSRSCYYIYLRTVVYAKYTSKEQTNKKHAKKHTFTLYSLHYTLYIIL